jgi:signal transduction histidine kinase
VWVETHVGEESVRVEVIDTGPGIPVEERTRIFEKFTQIQGRVGSRRGSGLGLAFCKMAVEAHGGNIWVEDGPDGRGSRFAFTLPYRSEPG